MPPDDKVQLDFSKATPVASSQETPPVRLDFSKAQPINGANVGTFGPTGRLGLPTFEKGIDKVAGVYEGIGKGALKTVGGLAELTGEALNRIPGIGETLAPRTGLEAEKKLLGEKTQLNTPEEKGAALAEEGVEWMGGDAALKALGKLRLISAHAPEVLHLVEKFPTTARLLLGATRGATVGGTQAGVKAPAEGKEPVEEGAKGALGGVIGGGAGEALGIAAESKAARGLVNRSLGATARDVTYGNPAKALLDEDIKVPTTGDAELYKEALRQGKSVEEAVQAAGGRIAAVGQKINEYKPRLDALLAASKVKIPVKDAIISPIYEASKEIINNHAMTEAEKDAAIDKLIALQTSLLDGLGKEIKPAEANEIKRQLGERINWGGTTAVTDEVKPVYKALYGSLKHAVHQGVPEAGPLDERLTNLMAAWGELNPGKAGSLPLKEEVEAGPGPLSGGFKGVMGRLESIVGRAVPATAAAVKSPVTKTALGEGGVIFFTASDGSTHSVPSNQLDAAKKIDPELRVTMHLGLEQAKELVEKLREP